MYSVPLNQGLNWDFNWQQEMDPLFESLGASVSNSEEIEQQFPFEKQNQDFLSKSQSEMTKAQEIGKSFFSLDQQLDQQIEEELPDFSEINTLGEPNLEGLCDDSQVPSFKNQEPMDILLIEEKNESKALEENYLNQQMNSEICKQAILPYEEREAKYRSKLWSKEETQHIVAIIRLLLTQNKMRIQSLYTWQNYESEFPGRTATSLLNKAHKLLARMPVLFQGYKSGYKVRSHPRWTQEENDRLLKIIRSTVSNKYSFSKNKYSLRNCTFWETYADQFPGRSTGSLANKAQELIEKQKEIE